MAIVVVVPVTEGFQLEVLHDDLITIARDLGIPRVFEREVRYLAPYCLEGRRGAWRLYYIRSAVLGTLNTEILVGNSFVLNEPWEDIGEQIQVEYHPLSTFGLKERYHGMLQLLSEDDLDD